MATTTSFSSDTSTSKVHNRHGNIGWVAPGDLKPKSLITSQYGPALQDDELISLARALSNLDHHLLVFVDLMFNLILSGRFNAGDVAAQVQARHDIADIATIESQFNQITNGQLSFSDMYLKDRHMLYYWQKSFSLMSQVLQVGTQDPAYAPTLDYLRNAIEKAKKLEGLLIDAASKGLLRPEYRTVFGDRWDKLDQVCGVYHKHSQSPRTLATWQDLSAKMKEAMKTAPEDEPMTAPSSQFWTLTTMIWLTFGGTALCNVWTFSLAYYYSPHRPGSAKDADFWFLLQACITQSFGLGISCLPLKKSRLPKWSWIPPMTIALICTLLAAPLYVLVPTEWSSFLTLTATSVQAFVVLQLALIGG